MSTDSSTIRVVSRLPVSRSAAEVCAYISDVRRWPEWAPTVGESWVSGGAALAPGARVEQRAKLMFGLTRHRAQTVTLVESPYRLAFAGPLGTSRARWGMEFVTVADGHSEAEMWVEIDLRNIMRVLPKRAFACRIQRVMDIEMVAIQSAVEADPPVRSDPGPGMTTQPVRSGGTR